MHLRHLKRAVIKTKKNSLWGDGMKLLSFGEILFDIYENGEFLGGAPLNFAAHTALQGAEAYLLSAVGEDALGKKAIGMIEDLGVKTKYIRMLSDKKTGKCIVTLDENAVPSYNILNDTAYDYIFYPKLSRNEKFDVLAFGTLSLRQENNIGTIKKLIKKKVCSQIYVDLNLRRPFYSSESLLLCLENATIVKMSDEELPIVTSTVFGENMNIEDAVRSLSERFNQIQLILITCGESGSCAYDCIEDKLYYCNAEKANVVSTVGAGDSFGATFLVRYLDNKDIPECLYTASKVSAYVVANKDAIPSGMSDFIKNL